jgi:protein-S-isoprenylcysteine O-methyltransferase Ste14
LRACNPTHQPTVRREALLHMALLIYFVLFFLLAFVWRSVVVYRSSGKNPFVLPAEDSAHGYVGRAFKALIAAVALLVTLDAVHPGALGPIGLLQIPALEVTGWALLLASLGWLLVAQAHMGISWRVGIDSKNATPLVSHGLFAVSRNPIFLAMRINLLGLFFVLPNGATLAVLVAGELLMQIQVRLEEAHLASLHGEAFAQYAKRVRRWL